MSPTTGAEMVVMRRRMAAARMKMVPRWWRGDVRAILGGGGGIWLIGWIGWERGGFLAGGGGCKVLLSLG